MRIAANPILRRLLTAAIVCLSPFSGSSETPPNFRWVSPIHGSDRSYVALWNPGLAVDNAGNSVMVGKFENRERTITIGGTTLTNSSLFLVKWDQTGQVVWLKADGSNYTERPVMGLDGANNLYVLCMPSWRSPEEVVSLAGTNVAGSIVLCKYDATGQALWARTLSTTFLQPVAMSVDSVGNSHSLIVFDGQITIGETNLDGNFPQDYALVKCNPDGRVLWVRMVAGDSFREIYDLALDPSGHVYITGFFDSSISFGATNLVSQGGSDTFVAKYRPDGELLWVKQSGGTNNDSSYHVAADDAGNCIIAPRFYQTATFGNITLSNSVAKDYHAVVKYDPNGNVLWAHQPAGSRSSLPALATDRDKNCYFAGQTESTNLLIIKYNPAGDLLWSKVGPEVEPRVLRADSLGHCYLGSVPLTAAVNFDGFAVTTTNMWDFILTKLDTTTAPQLSARLAGDAVCLSWSVLAEDYHLEFTPDLASPASWTSNTAPVVVTDVLKAVTVPKSAGTSFFRLKRP
jgi:hypothetical protein